MTKIDFIGFAHVIITVILQFILKAPTILFINAVVKTKSLFKSAVGFRWTPVSDKNLNNVFENLPIKT